MFIIVNGIKLDAKTDHDTPIGLLAKYCYDSFNKNVNDCVIYTVTDEGIVVIKDPTIISWGLKVEVGVPPQQK